MTSSRLRFLPAISACALGVPFAAAAPAPASTDRMDQIARHYVDAKQFMGAVLVARGDEVLFSQAYGSANLEWNIPNAANTKFRIGSVTKQFTAAAILLLEERGKLKVEDAVKTHYPEAPEAWDKITLAHLLTHTSGISNFTSFPDYETFARVPATPADLVKLFRDKPLDFTPGAEMRYSNSGYIVLGVVIEKASGTTYAKFLEQNIFQPLGMGDSGYDSNAVLIQHRASGYVLSPTGLENANYLSMTVPFAAGALYSTVDNLHRWEQGLFGGKVLSASSLQKMLTPPKGDYAFGIAVGKRAGQKVYEHGGGIDGFNCKLSYYPDDKVTVVALSNLNGPGADLIVEKLGAVVHGEAAVLPSERKSVAVPRAVLEKYVGSYRFGPGVALSFTIEGAQLVAQLAGQPKLPLRAETQTVFYPTAIEARVEFKKNSSGKVTGVLISHNGRDTLAPRDKDGAPTR